MERSYYRRPHAIKNQLGASKQNTPQWVQGALDARAGSLWHKTAGKAIPRNSRCHWKDQSAININVKAVDLCSMLN